MESWFETIKTLGSLVALATGAFLIYDRLLKDRPIAFLRVRSGRLELHVKNVADGDLLIEAIEVTPDSMRVAFGSDLEDTIRAAAAQGFMTTIHANREASFPLVTTRAWDSIKADQDVRFSIRWSFTRSRWFPHFPTRVVKTAGYIKMLNAAKEPGKP